MPALIRESVALPEAKTSFDINCVSGNSYFLIIYTLQLNFNDYSAVMVSLSNHPSTGSG